ncbi:MAG TPA: SDR family NAD(P)-dependent oxidoreductase [Candidatus Limnocylindrales bacterium]|jgi:NAD(P)-dependent dehydrogenase (short-subunit alcohol dehydrogenase family)|nr:SDR family NAD(P)-dependent oxidoreductase [Candidatus Limnocylindrales bacterium]
MTDRVVLITGATGELGRVTARTFAEAGARLALSGTDEAGLREIVTDLGLDGDRWMPVVVDLRDRDATRDALAATEAALGRFDVLAHLVGGWSGGTLIAELDPAEVTSMLDQHLWTTLNVTQSVVPGMVQRGWGRVMAVSAPAATEPTAKTAPYAIGKAAEEALLRTLARETANTGVTVNLVIVKAIDEKRERTTDPKKTSWTTPEEIAAVFRFLASDDAAAVSGARIPLFGR